MKKRKNTHPWGVVTTIPMTMNIKTGRVEKLDTSLNKPEDRALNRKPTSLSTWVRSKLSR